MAYQPPVRPPGPGGYRQPQMQPARGYQPRPQFGQPMAPPSSGYGGPRGGAPGYHPAAAPRGYAPPGGFARGPSGPATAPSGPGGYAPPAARGPASYQPPARGPPQARGPGHYQPGPARGPASYNPASPAGYGAHTPPAPASYAPTHSAPHHAPPARGPASYAPQGARGPAPGARGRGPVARGPAPGMPSAAPPVPNNSAPPMPGQHAPAPSPAPAAAAEPPSTSRGAPTSSRRYRYPTQAPPPSNNMVGPPPVPGAAGPPMSGAGVPGGTPPAPGSHTHARGKSAPKLYNPATTGRTTPATAAVPEAFAGGNYGSGPSSGGASAAFAAPAAGVRPPPIDESLQCAPEYMNLTTSCIPTTKTSVAKTSIPIALSVHPMAKFPGMEPVPLVNFGTAGVVRCGRCRAYIHPFSKFVNGGRQWRCSMCGKINDVPSAYYSALDEHGNRMDLADHPELTNGSVEIVAPAEYMVRPPQAPVYMFVIDVSHNAVNSGMLQHAVRAIKHCVENSLLPGGERTQVGFITFDSSVHFYNLKASLSAPQMLVVSDITDLFLPIPDELLVNLTDSRSVVEALLDSLPEMFADTRNVESAMGPAVEAAFKVMRHIGGKMVVMQASLPSLGVGRLKHRENPKMLGGEMEHSLLSPDSTHYRNLALEFSRNQISVDMFMAATSYIDVATLSTLSRYTAGQAYHYPGFSSASSGARLEGDLIHDLSRPTGFEAVMRVRCTKGLKVTAFHGNFFIRGTDLLALPNVTSDTCCTVELEHLEALNPATLITIQAALLYTSSTGERRICVHTRACTVTSVLADVFKKADVDALASLFAKTALDRARRVGFPNARVWLHRRCVDVVRSFRLCTSSAYGAQQIQQQLLPENLMLLPLYTMGLEKSPLLRGGTDIRIDTRAQVFFQVAGMPVTHTKRFIHPVMYSLHDMGPEDGLPVPAGATNNDGSAVKTVGKLNLRRPRVISLSAGQLIAEGIVLLDDGLQMYLWLGRSAAPTLVGSLFDTPSLDGVDCSTLLLTERDNDYSRRVFALIKALQEDRPCRQPIRVVRANSGDQAEVLFLWRLVEDPASYPGGKISYKDFFASIGRESQQARPAPGTAVNSGR